MRVIGADVSHWEGLIDWQTAVRWLPFVYYKATDGVGMIDNTFTHNHSSCQALGMPHAGYHFFQPGQDPTTQANWYISAVGVGDRRYIVDVEELGEDLPARLNVFLRRCEQLTSQKPAIYTSPGFWNEFVKPKPAWSRSYELIVAHYTSEHSPVLPIGWDAWTMWQYTDSFYFPGCISAADGDWFNGSLGQAREWFGNYREIDPPTISHTQLRSHFNNLHVRKTPSTSAQEVDHLSKGDLVELEDLGGADVWVRHARGWTCVEKDGYRYMEVVK